jgi:hypothetical protein
MQKDLQDYSHLKDSRPKETKESLHKKERKL